MPSQKDVAAESGAPMIPEQRRELILRQLRKQHVLSVHQLMEMFDCSHMTVRRDIALLEQEGLAYSVTGGVRIASQLHSEPSHQVKAVVELPQKQAMAKLAARLLLADMTIYLDAGTSTLEIVPYIKLLSGMTVVTNDFGVVQALMDAPHVTVIHTGGAARPFQSFLCRRPGGGDTASGGDGYRVYLDQLLGPATRHHHTVGAEGGGQAGGHAIGVPSGAGGQQLQVRHVQHVQNCRVGAVRCDHQ